MDKESDLDLMKKIQKDIFLLGWTRALLYWDLETYMPKNASEERSEQLALLDSMIHEKATSQELFNVLERLKKENLDLDENLIVERLYKEVLKAKKLPNEFVKELSRATSLGFSAWQEAREKNDFSIFKPHLEKIIELKKKQAKYINLPGHIYNSLLDDYEEGMTVEILKPQFDKLKKEVLNLLNDIKNSDDYKKQEVVLLNKNFPREDQIELSKDVMERIGLKKESSRIDFAEHPFTTRLGGNDVRITTNLREEPLFSFTSTIHEAGHGLYELNLPREFLFTSINEAPGMGIHESQSRFWENMIGKGKPFWKYYFKEFDRRFNLGNFEKWYKEINFLRNPMIRIESDEVNYPIHIILRFEIELGLIEEKIKVEDLPRIWNEKMKEYFDVVPKNDKEGVLQDVHWSGGNIGYFPTYILGTAYASQIYNAMKKEILHIEKEIENGDFSKISEWLKEKIHKHGRKFTSEDIIKKICGEGLNLDSYLDYLRKKYSEIYNI